jgi:hypothetical protein
MWADTLTSNEVEATLKAADELANISWAFSLLDRTRPILNRLREGFADKDALLAHRPQPSEMSFLFEIRFARALADAGLVCSYEYNAGVGNSTVDFYVDLNPPWLIELVSLHESDAFKAAAWVSGENQGYLLSTISDDPRQSIEGETLKAQERIGEKVFDGKRAIKFPEPNGFIHLVIVDARGFGGAGYGDCADWYQIAYGPQGLRHELVKHWTNPKNSATAPISGLFEDECPIRAARTLQDRLHFVGFICERNYAVTEIRESTLYCCNSRLFESKDAARMALSRWPLRGVPLYKESQ